MNDEMRNVVLSRSNRRLKMPAAGFFTVDRSIPGAVSREYSTGLLRAIINGWPICCRFCR